MTILITGGAGFIGANFVARWLASEAEPIVNLDKLTYAGNSQVLDRLRDPRHHFFRFDIGDAAGVTGLLHRFKPRAILHFAAESHVDRSISGPAEFVETNIVGTFNLLESARHYYASMAPDEAANFRFVHVSTDEVYGELKNDEAPATETRAYAPNSPYSASKASADHLVRAYHRTYGLPTLITHCTNNYGPFQYPEKLIPLVIERALAGQPIPVYGSGHNVRDWLHVHDHCNALHIVLERGQVGHTYNIGANEEVANIDLVSQICSLIDELMPDPAQADRSKLITFVADRPGHDWRYALDSSKLRSQLGWKPKRRLAEGLRQTVVWFLANRQWLSQNPRESVHLDPL